MEQYIVVGIIAFMTACALAALGFYVCRADKVHQFIDDDPFGEAATVGHPDSPKPPLPKRKPREAEPMGA